MEGLAIARYDVLMSDLERLFGAVFWAVAIAALVFLGGSISAMFMSSTVCSSNRSCEIAWVVLTKISSRHIWRTVPLSMALSMS